MIRIVVITIAISALTRHLILLVLTLFRLICRLAYGCTDYCTSSHTDKTADVTSSMTTRDTTYGRTDYRAEPSTCNRTICSISSTTVQKQECTN